MNVIRLAYTSIEDSDKSKRPRNKECQDLSMPDEHYINPKLAAIYDLDSGWGPDMDFYLALAVRPCMGILDLGCGTGLLCRAYAERGNQVTGVDPATAMLDVAKLRDQASNVDWVEATAESFSSNKRFDLITMTGHAFQVLLDDSSIEAALENIARHLKKHGRFVFETRNPAIDWHLRWNCQWQIEQAGLVITEHLRVLSHLDDRIRFETSYVFPDETLVSTSELRFLDLPALEQHIGAAGLAIERLQGDWNGRSFDAATSDEIIITARLA